jgi:putative transposase
LLLIAGKERVGKTNTVKRQRRTPPPPAKGSHQLVLEEGYALCVGSVGDIEARRVPLAVDGDDSFGNAARPTIREEIIATLRKAEVLPGHGRKVAEVVKAIGSSEVSFWRWRKEYGGLNVSQAKCLRDVERENAHLRLAVSDLTLDKLIQETVRGNV